MRPIFVALLLGAIALGGQAHAADDYHSEAKRSPAAKGATKPQVKPAVIGSGMPMMENMDVMQSQMEKMSKTSDPKEREKLMQEHMKSMQDAMAKMRGMGGGMMGSMTGKDGES